MKKVSIIAAAIFSIFLIGCSANEKPNINNKDIKQSVANKNNIELEKSCPVKLGMSIDTVKSILKKNNIKIDNEIEITSKETDSSFGNKELWVDDVTLEFSKKDSKLISIKGL